MRVRRTMARLVAAALAVGFAAGVAACATFGERKAMHTERMLAAAGFQMKFASTPERRAALEKLPQRKLVPRQKHGEVHFVYADTAYCKCLYAGTEQAYQQYQRLVLQERSLDEQQATAMANAAAAFDQKTAAEWEGWGPGSVWEE